VSATNREFEKTRSVTAFSLSQAGAPDVPAISNKFSIETNAGRGNITDNLPINMSRELERLHLFSA